jgi:hypothetical protein
MFISPSMKSESPALDRRKPRAVCARLSLEDLLSISPLERRRVLQENQLRHGAQSTLSEANDRRKAVRADPSGLG